jgi:putative acetyltransferase
MIVREQSAGDEAAVFDVVASAFAQPAEAQLVRELERAGDAVISLVAEEDGRVVGHILLSKMGAPFPALALAPLSVIPEKQGKGFGSALMKSAIERARRGAWDAIFVLGNPAYYGRFGFDVTAAAGFSTPYAGPNFMVLALSSHLPTRSGALSYAAAFSALD